MKKICIVFLKKSENIQLCHEMADAEAELRAEEEELQTLKEVLEEMNYEDEAGEKEDESK